MDLTNTEKRLLWVIHDLVAQHCVDTSKDDGQTMDDHISVFSNFIRADAEAIRVLGEFNVAQITSDNEDRVVSGIVLGLTDTAKALKSGIFADVVKRT